VKRDRVDVKRRRGAEEPSKRNSSHKPAFWDENRPGKFPEAGNIVVLRPTFWLDNRKVSPAKMKAIKRIGLLMY